MIKASEVRINNYVQYNPSGVDKGTKIIPLQIEEIIFDNVSLYQFGLNDGFSNMYLEHEVDPIPITTEWLERLGFVSAISPKGHENWIKYDAKHLAFVLREITPFIGFTYHSYGTDHSIQLNSIHQLQNLYFALTGQELTVKE